jgi:hypothetical protein
MLGSRPIYEKIEKFDACESSPFDFWYLQLFTNAEPNEPSYVVMNEYGQVGCLAWQEQGARDWIAKN